MIPNTSTKTNRKVEASQNNLTVLNDLIISYGSWPLQPLSPEGQLKVHSAPFRGSFPSVLSEAMRSAGLGSRVMVTQLLKGGVGQGPDGVVKLCGRLEWLRPDIPYCINKKLLANKNKLEKDSINQVWDISKDRLLNGELDQLVLDEVGLAISLGYLEESVLISALEQRPVATDVVLTGPSIPQSVMALADQVTVLRSGI